MQPLRGLREGLRDSCQFQIVCQTWILLAADLPVKLSWHRAMGGTPRPRFLRRSRYGHHPASPLRGRRPAEEWPPGMMEPRPMLWVRVRTMTGETTVPQPLRVSLSLRNTWLLPGYWNHKRLFESGGGETRRQGDRLLLLAGGQGERLGCQGDGGRDGPMPSALRVPNRLHSRHLSPKIVLWRT